MKLRTCSKQLLLNILKVIWRSPEVNFFSFFFADHFFFNKCSIGHFWFYSKIKGFRQLLFQCFFSFLLFLCPLPIFSTFFSPTNFLLAIFGFTPKLRVLDNSCFKVFFVFFFADFQFFPKLFFSCKFSIGHFWFHSKIHGFRQLLFQFFS